MALDTTLTNVIIEDNTFDYNTLSPDGTLITVGTTYGYTNCILISADAKISGNHFSGALSASSQVVVTGAGSCNITENTFVRGATPVVYYIDVSAATNDQVIVDNIFDNPTIDGTSENLVNLPVLSTSIPTPTITFHHNKNQTGYLPIQKFPYLMEKSAPPGPNASVYSKYQFSSGNFDQVRGVITDVTGFYNAEGPAISYPFPFNEAGALKFSGSFQVTNGSTTVTVNNLIAPSIIWQNAENAYVTFGNDNKYYTTASLNNSGTNAALTAITLSTPYTGASNFNVNGNVWVYRSGFNDPPLANPLNGTFTFSGATLTCTVSQSNVLSAGSLITFQDGTGPYTVSAVSANGETITLTASYVGGLSSSSNATSNSVYSYYNFSFNLTELLPLDVQILDMIVGFWGNNVSSVVSATYLAFSYVSPQSVNFTTSALTNTMADVKNFAIPSVGGTDLLSSLTIGNAFGDVTLATYNAATQYLVLTPSSSSAGVPNYYTTRQGTVIRFNLSEILVTQSSNAIFLTESPLIVKYRW